jgi:hypothetical protein
MLLAIGSLCGFAVAGCASPGRADAQAGSAVIAIDSLHLSAAGTLVDLRYRVVDPQRAQEMLGSKVRPKLIDERTGIEMSVPTTAKLGSLRQTQGQQRTGRTYFVLFVNNAGVATGSRVTAELGELRFRHLVVE